MEASENRKEIPWEPPIYSRPEKGSHLFTIQYEIDMLNFCYESLISNAGKWGDIRNAWACLESFLLHYRNLVEFFGGEGDLKSSETDVWAPRKLTHDEVASISDNKLCKKYRGAISAYLQHCTKIRAQLDRSWNVLEMYDDIKGLTGNFRRLFP
jgi:hypothetical protein